MKPAWQMLLAEVEERSTGSSTPAAPLSAPGKTKERGKLEGRKGRRKVKQARGGRGRSRQNPGGHGGGKRGAVGSAQAAPHGEAAEGTAGERLDQTVDAEGARPALPLWQHHWPACLQLPPCRAIRRQTVAVTQRLPGRDLGTCTGE